jgi:hypothetical protein
MWASVAVALLISLLLRLKTRKPITRRTQRQVMACLVIGSQEEAVE